MVGCIKLIVGRPINYVAGTVRVRVYPRVRVGLGSNFEYGSGTGRSITGTGIPGFTRTEVQFWAYM